MKYCVRCILPDARPGIFLDEQGVCSGCRGHDDKENHIDWAARANAFSDVVAEAKNHSSGYDCIVPVSGGKDSWYQVITSQKHGLKVLGVTWRTPGRTTIGQRNVERMVSQLGIDHSYGTPMGMQMLGYDSETILPTVVIADGEGKIILADQTDNYRIRPEPETFLRAFDEHALVITPAI